MKKFSLLTVLMALSMFVFVFTAGAQTELPAIDEEAAADLLGTWYMDMICDDDGCLSLPEFGVTSTLVINADNTMVMQTEDEDPAILEWFMEDGTAYIIEYDEDENPVAIEFGLDEDGNLNIAETENSFVTFIRDMTPVPGKAEIVADATLEDFEGDWYMYSLDYTLPASFLGLNNQVLSIGEDSFIISDGENVYQDTTNFILEDGTLQAIAEGVNFAGEETLSVVVMEYHADDSIVMICNPDTDDTYSIVFTREKNESEFDLEALFADVDFEDLNLEDLNLEDLNLDDLNLEDLNLEDLNLEGLNEEELEAGFLALFSGIGEKLEEEGIDLNSLVEGVSEKLNEEGIDLNSILEGLTSGSEDGEGFNLDSLMSVFSSEGTGK